LPTRRKWQSMVDCTVAEYGRLDMAFNNAGIQVPPSDAADEAIENFERVTAVNQRGIWACMKHELRVMRAQGSSAIVNCSSLGGLVGLPLGTACKARAQGSVFYGIQAKVSGFGPMRPTSPLSSASMRAISPVESAKSKMSRFSRIRSS